MAHNKMLDNQIAQLSTSSRQPGTLSSRPEKSHDTAIVIHLRSGLTYDKPVMPESVEEVIIEELDMDAEGKPADEDAVIPEKSQSTEISGQSTKTDEQKIGETENRRSTENSGRSTDLVGQSTFSPDGVADPSSIAIGTPSTADKSSISDKGKSNVADPSIVIKAPFPGRLKNTKVEQQFGKFLEVVKNLQVTVPFTELITQVPSYAKFMKDILTRKRSFNEVETIAFTEECSALLQSKSPPKLKDLGSFSIPCTIGTHVIDKALCDLGASVSVIPYSVCEKLNMRHLKVTNVTLQMADRTVKRPLGVLEDVSVKIGKFFIPVDFIVLEMAEDTQILIILGRPFLHTAGAIIDVKQGRLTLEVGDDRVTFNLASTLAKPMIEDTCYAIDLVDESMFDYWTRSLLGDPLEALIALDDFAEDEQVDYETMKVALKGREFTIEKGETVNAIMETSYAVEVKKPELKPLPSHLKYVFLDDHEQYLVIVSSKLDDSQLADFLGVLRKNKKAMVYSLDDLTGISPDFGMHRINLEEGHKPRAQGLCRLNQNMQDVVRKEVMKLLDAGCHLRYIEVNLVLNWEKCHFMVNEGVVLGHLVSDRGIQVDRAKVQLIEQLPPPVKAGLDHSTDYSSPRLGAAFRDNEMLAVVYALEKLRSYLLGSKFDLEIRDKKGSENLITDHLSRLELQNEGYILPINKSFPDDILLAISNAETPWYADYANFIVGNLLPPDRSYQQRKRFLYDVKEYFWDDPYLFKECADGLYRRCIPQWDTEAILEACHSFSYGGHHGPSRTEAKVLQSGFYWPSMFKDAKDFVVACDACQRTGNISRRHEMPQVGIL
ncbi:uncharacterized protein LOC141629765 [Silene latifolia]|uniref:uncharacterized protein LOC141629765 n=1 Tax=Silene latifolia TaxID=37657 RepID=UPI003D76C3AD